MKKIVFISLSLVGQMAFAQKVCTSNPTTINSDINFGSIVWSPSGGATAGECNDMADGLITFTGNVIVDLANGVMITISNNVNIVGSFPITGGPGAQLRVSGGGTATTLHVTGNLGNSGNNGVTYSVPLTTDHIRVDGTLFGKNTNAFSGNGTITGGTLDVKNTATCPAPCPVSGGFSFCNSDDSFCADQNVLPVVLTNFDHNCTPHSVKFQWSTATEINFDFFSLQRSLDGLDFSTIAKIPGHGTTVEPQHYAFEDFSPFIGKSYYRLQSTDFDGYEEIFKVISVNYGGDKSVSIFPHPVSNKTVSIQLSFSPIDIVSIQILDLNGIEMVNYENSDQLSSYALDLNSGTYLLKVTTGDFSKIQRIIIP